MKRIGKKGKEWLKAKPKLIKIYFGKGITRCEISGSKFFLDFHHILKRNSQEAEHTFEGTRLLNQEWHTFCEYNKEANNLLIKKPRGFNKDYFEKFKEMKEKKEKRKSDKSDWQNEHSCKRCKRIVSTLICSFCGKISI
jgi:hypothetical protein